MLALERLCGFPRTWDPGLRKLALSLAALREAAKTKKLGKLESRSITGTSLWPPSCTELGRRWRRMRRAYQTGWVGETCLGSQTVICPGFHLTDWLQSQWVLLMAFCWGQEGGSTPPPSESLTAQLGPQATLSF